MKWQSLLNIHPNPLVRWIMFRRLTIVLEMINLKTNQKILDFGCGTGILFLQMPIQDNSYYGVDIILWPAEETLTHHNRNDVILLDAKDWIDRIPNKSLDCIIASEVLEHVDNVQHIILLFTQKIKPDGKLIITGPTENILYQISRKIAGFSGDYHERNISDIMKIVENAGLRSVNHKTIPLFSPFNLFGLYTLKANVNLADE